jgi:hypothetical protein
MPFVASFFVVPAKAGIHSSSIHGPGIRDPAFAAARRVSVYETVKLGGVLAGDLVHHIGR